MQSGYSRTPLIKKLGLKDDHAYRLIHAPKGFSAFIQSGTKASKKNKAYQGKLDFVLLFCKNYNVLDMCYDKVKSALDKTGILWISWPKKSSALHIDLHRDLIREFVLERGLVDVKVASINEDWSALKFVYRLTDR